MLLGAQCREFSKPVVWGNRGLHPGFPWFSSLFVVSAVCRPTPRSQSKKNHGVYHFPGKTRERVYNIGPERRVCTIEASDPEIEKKGGFYTVGGVCMFRAKKGGFDENGENDEFAF